MENISVHCLNQFLPVVPKGILTILVVSLMSEHYLENISRRNFDQNPTPDPPCELIMNFENLCLICIF